MEINDKKIRKMLEKADLYFLTESIEIWPEEERNGRTDLQIITEEADYYLGLFQESGNVYSDDLADAREILHETKNGKVIPCGVSDLRPIYTGSEIENAKRTVSEYRRLVRLAAKLNEI